MAETPTFQRQNPYVALPTRMFLTTEGLRLFAAKPDQLKRVKNRMGIVKEAIESDRYNALLVQKLVLNSCIEEVYVRLPNLLQYRQDLISTNNLILYAILYKKLSPSLADMLCQSPVVQAYNRKNPKYAIVGLNMISRQKIDAIRMEKPQLFEAMESEIMEEVKARIKRQPISDEDKQIRERSLEKFIAWIDKRIWYIYLIIYQTQLKRELVRSFTDMLVTYLGRTQIATHLSSLLMEFVQNAEKAHFERIVIRKRFAAEKMADSFIRDRKNREAVIAEAVRMDQMLEVAWNVNPETISVGQQYRIGITISNYGIISEDTRMKLAKKMNADVEGISLDSFYTEKGEDKLGAGLGLLYNSYLEEICHKEGLLYRCNIFPEPEKEKTTVRLDITL
ncbi:MAG TPA: hypothetical protein PLM00_03685 [Spirochaetota bacterium]|nr:hypothetical protein [Spirochaetota bacterium]HPN82464.1 hypothetical protein [Spirochaetota bacterium]